MKQYRKKEGFTIVELVIVIGVVGILTAILVPTFINLNKKAEEASNQSFVRNLNTQMAIREQTEGKNATMFEAVKEAKEIGFDVEKLTPVDNRDLVWDSRDNRFALLEQDGTVFYSEGKWSLPSQDKHKVWKVYGKMPGTQTYSIYAKEGWDVSASSTVDNLQVGFDVGKNEGFTKISYVGNATAKTVAIRTNGVDTELTVDNAYDTVKHYDLIGSVDVVKTADASYHEFGKAGYVQVASGRIVAEKGGSVDTAVIVAKGEGATLDAVIENAGGTISKAYATSAELVAANNAKARALQLSTADSVVSTDLLSTLKTAAISAVNPNKIDGIPLRQADIENAIKELTTGTYYLSEDINASNLGKYFKISNNNTVVLDLAGHTLSNTAENSTDLESYAISVDGANATLTIKDSVGGGALRNDAKSKDRTYAIMGTNTNLVLEGGTYGGSNPRTVAIFNTNLHIKVGSGNINGVTDATFAPFGPGLTSSVHIYNAGLYRFVNCSTEFGITELGTKITGENGLKASPKTNATYLGLACEEYTFSAS